MNANMAVIAPALHVNGVREVKLAKGGVYNPANRKCTSGCHKPETW